MGVLPLVVVVVHKEDSRGISIMEVETLKPVEAEWRATDEVSTKVVTLGRDFEVHAIPLTMEVNYKGGLLSREQGIVSTNFTNYLTVS